MLRRFSIVMVFALAPWAPLAAEVPAEAAEEAVDGVETPAEKKSLTPMEERSRAFVKALKFTSKGQMRALLFKMDRDLRITLEPVREGEALTAVDAHVLDVANGGKTYEGRLDLTPRGSLKTDVPQLINTANIVLVDPVIRAALVKGEGPVVTHGQIETAGAVRLVEFTHSIVGEPADDGSMQVETKTATDDGKVNLKTITTLAPDGLPWLAETTGTVKKGPVDVNVNLKLTRDMAGSTGD
jgi:hypothetical protein